MVLIASCGLTTAALGSGQPPPDRRWRRRLARGAGHGESGMHFLGATLLLLAAWMAGISLAFGVSWLTIIDRVGAVVLARA